MWDVVNTPYSTTYFIRPQVIVYSGEPIALRWPILVHVRKVIPLYFRDPVLQFSKSKVRVSRRIQNSFNSENLTRIWGNESQSKIHINLHNLPTKTVNNSVIHVGTTIYFGRILEGFWPKKYRLCNPSCPRKVELTEYFKQLHYSIKSHLSGGRCNMTDSPPYSITCNQTSSGSIQVHRPVLILEI